MGSNQAAWLDGVGSPLRVGPAEMPTPGPDDVVIRNFAVAVNPVDWKVQATRSFIQTWPFVPGTDSAGEVQAVGSNVTKFRPGDRVIAHNDGLMRQHPSRGAFQLYTTAAAATTASLPHAISYRDGVVLPLALDTAIMGLVSPRDSGFLGLPFPSLNTPPSGQVLVVWGGSSSVGAVTIQLAVAAGVTVIATASRHNFPFCRECGAADVFDHTSASVLADVVAAVRRAGGDFIGVYDAVSLPGQTYPHTVPLVEQLGGGNLVVVTSPPEHVPAGVKVGQAFAVHPVVHPLWEKYVTPALESGKLKCLPPPLVVGKGLESLQSGLDQSKKGVSAKKVVVELA